MKWTSIINLKILSLEHTEWPIAASLRQWLMIAPLEQDYVLIVHDLYAGDTGHSSRRDSEISSSIDLHKKIVL